MSASAEALEPALNNDLVSLPVKHGSRLTPERRATIYTLADVLKLSTNEIAHKLSMDWRTVRSVLQQRDADAVICRNLLTANGIDFVKDWMCASKKGAAKGRHEPARDALYALNVVSPPQQAQQNQSVTVILSGGELPKELRIGVLQTQQAATNVAEDTD